MLSARVVALTNSVVFNRSGVPITEVCIVTSRLSFRMVRALTAAVVARMSSHPAHRLLAKRLWEHTANIAALAHLLSRRVARQDLEIAMFVGIVHEVGGLCLFSRALDFPWLFDGSAQSAT